MLLVATFSAVSAPSASAETLDQALDAAYQRNPTLDSERARLRATDEDVARARAGFRPRADITAYHARLSSSDTKYLSPSNAADPHGYDLTFTQPVFRGFRTLNNVLQNEEAAEAGRKGLIAAESRLFVLVVAAYMGVIRDRNIVHTRRTLVENLNAEVRTVQARAAVQEASAADLSQALSRRARAVAEADASLADLRASQAIYAEVVGHAPGELVEPRKKLESKLPPDLESALFLAQRHPAVEAAKKRERAAAHAVEVIRGELLPEVNIEGRKTRAWSLDPDTRYHDDFELTARVKMPLYEGGETYARIRKAKEEQIALAYDVRATVLEAERTVTVAYARFNSAKSQLLANQIRATEAQKAMDSVIKEEKVGARTVLDVLNARQEASDAKIALITNGADYTVGSYQILAAAGLLSGAELGVSETIYIPEAHLEETRHKPFGTRVSEEPVRANLVNDTIGGWTTTYSLAPSSLFGEWSTTVERGEARGR